MKTDKKVKKHPKVIRWPGPLRAALGATLWACSVFFHVSAETVTQKSALGLATTFFNEMHGTVMAAPKLVWTGKRLTTDRLFTPFYVYNHPAGGWVMISAENKAYPILAFGLRGAFSPDRIGEAERELFRQYAMAIENIRYMADVPAEAAAQWTYLPQTVHATLHSALTSSDAEFDAYEASEDLFRVLHQGPDAFRASSHNPKDFQLLVEKELKAEHSVGVALTGRSDDYPAVVRGQKGDFFLMDMPETNDWWVRLNATEIIPAGMVAYFTHNVDLPAGNPQHDSPNHEEMTRASRDALSAVEFTRLEITASPTIISSGGGHYTVRLPEEARMARIFNLSGQMVAESYYRESDTVIVDLEKQPGGFYLLLVIGDSGRGYAFKVAR